LETQTNKKDSPTLEATREGNKIVLTFETNERAKDFFDDVLQRYSSPRWLFDEYSTWSVKEVVQHYEIPAITVHLWVKKGRLVNVASGRVLRFRRTQVEAVMAKYGRRRFSTRNQCR